MLADAALGMSNCVAVAQVQSRLPSRRGGGRAEQAVESDGLRETLKVSSSTVPNKLAGAICNVVRESTGAMPGVMATGPASINQVRTAGVLAHAPRPG